MEYKTKVVPQSICKMELDDRVADVLDTIAGEISLKDGKIDFETHSESCPGYVLDYSILLGDSRNLNAARQLHELTSGLLLTPAEEVAKKV